MGFFKDDKVEVIRDVEEVRLTNQRAVNKGEVGTVISRLHGNLYVVEFSDDTFILRGQDIQKYVERKNLKFKIGDRVKIVAEIYKSDYTPTEQEANIGDIGEIENVLEFSNCYMVKFNDKFTILANDTQLEEVAKPTIIDFVRLPYTANFTMSVNGDSEIVTHNVSIQEEKIKFVIDIEMRTVTCTIDSNYVGIAKCHIEDAFDENIGKEIAYRRATILKLQKEAVEFGKGGVI